MFTPAAPAAEAAGSPSTAESAQIRAINRARAAHGLRALSPHRRLARAADAYTRSMLRSNYSHGAFSSRVRRYVLSAASARTTAMTTRCSACKVVRMWLNSRRTARCCWRAASAGSAPADARAGWRRRACVVTADFGSRRWSSSSAIPVAISHSDHATKAGGVVEARGEHPERDVEGDGDTGRQQARRGGRAHRAGAGVARDGQGAQRQAGQHRRGQRAGRAEDVVVAVGVDDDLRGDQPAEAPRGP